MANIINPFDIPLHNVTIRGSGTLKLGRGCEIRDYTIIEFGDGDVVIDDNSVIGYSSFIQATGSLTVEKNSLLGPHGVYICSSHNTKRGHIVRDLPMTRGSISIRENVWTGANCTININTILNTGCVIGANSFVNKDIPEWEVWAGSPARYIKEVV